MFLCIFVSNWKLENKIHAYKGIFFSFLKRIHFEKLATFQRSKNVIEKHYNGGLTREQFLFFEIRIVSSLVLQGKSRNEIEQEIFSENLFQFPTEKMIKNITKTCLKRIDALNAPELVYHLANASLDVAKQINLYAIMCENRIVYDFLTEVIGEKYRSQDFTFSSKDVAIFFMELSEKVPAVHTWSASTLKKLKQVLVRFLIECDYLENTRSQNLLPVYLYPELEEVIRQKNDLDALPAFNCFH